MIGLRLDQDEHGVWHIRDARGECVGCIDGYVYGLLRILFFAEFSKATA